MAAAGALIEVCVSTRLTDGGPGVRFEVRAGEETIGAFAVRHRGNVYGYLNRCAHVAMELDWLPGQFFDADGDALICATHGAIYAPGNGQCLGGPCAGRGGLRPLQMMEQGGVVYWRAEPGLRPDGERRDDA